MSSELNVSLFSDMVVDAVVSSFLSIMKDREMEGIDNDIKVQIIESMEKAWGEIRESVIPTIKNAQIKVPIVGISTATTTPNTLRSVPQMVPQVFPQATPASSSTSPTVSPTRISPTRRVSSMPADRRCIWLNSTTHKESPRKCSCRSGRTEDSPRVGLCKSHAQSYERLGSSLHVDGFTADPLKVVPPDSRERLDWMTDVLNRIAGGENYVIPAENM